jgi:glycosyltransferase involved in cell wall biosynthesis
MTSAAGRTRVAFLAPLPPERTGVADHSAALLGPLAERFELEVFTRDPERSAAALRSGLPLRRFADCRPAAGDVAVYQLGNHAGHHAAIYQRALRWPGIAVLHEYVLHDLVRDCALQSGGPRAWSEELRYAVGRSGERLAAAIASGGEQPSPFDWPLFERAVDSSLAVIVHSRSARDRISKSRPLARVRVVPLALAPAGDLAAHAAALRQELGIAGDALVIGAFGVAAATKRLDVVLRAFGRLARADAGCVLLVVGPESPRFLAANAALDPALAPRVRVLDRVSHERLLAAMATTDLALNLRFPTGGECSSTCLRLLGLGRPVVVSDTGWFSEIPDACCAKHPVDALEEATLDAMLEALAASSDLRRALGANAREWARRHHSIDAAVAAYAEVIEEVAVDGRARGAAAAPLAAGRAAPPPLGRYAHDDVDTELLVEVTAALGDLGVTEADEDVLAAVASRVATLGLR